MSDNPLVAEWLKVAKDDLEDSRFRDRPSPKQAGKGVIVVFRASPKRVGSFLLNYVDYLSCLWYNKRQGKANLLFFAPV